MFVFEVWASNFALCFDAKFLKPLHNEHENVISAKKSFIKKSYKQFLGRNKIGVARFFFNFQHFFEFLFFSCILSQSIKYNIS